MVSSHMLHCHSREPLYTAAYAHQSTLRQHHCVVWRLIGACAWDLQGVRGVSPKRHSMEQGNQGRKGGAADAEQGSSSTGARKGGDALKREAPEQQGPVPKRTRRMRPDGAAAVASKPADSNCSDALSQVHSCLSASQLTTICTLIVLALCCRLLHCSSSGDWLPSCTQECAHSCISEELYRLGSQCRISWVDRG